MVHPRCLGDTAQAADGNGSSSNSSQHTETSALGLRGSTTASFERTFPSSTLSEVKEKDLLKKIKEMKRDSSSRMGTGRPTHPSVNNRKPMSTKKNYQPVLSHPRPQPEQEQRRAFTKILSILKVGTLQGCHSSSEKPPPSALRVLRKDKKGKP